MRKYPAVSDIVPSALATRNPAGHGRPSQRELVDIWADLTMKLAKADANKESAEPGDDDVLRDVGLEIEWDKALADAVFNGAADMLWQTTMRDWAEQRIADLDDDDNDDEYDLEELGEIVRGGPSEDPSDDALHAAKWWLGALAKVNGKTPDQLVLEALQHDTPKAIKKAFGRKEPGTSEYKAALREYALEFGGDCLMQSLGHGVSWFDDHGKFKLKLPRFEAYAYDGAGAIDWGGSVTGAREAM